MASIKKRIKAAAAARQATTEAVSEAATAPAPATKPKRKRRTKAEIAADNAAAEAARLAAQAEADADADAEAEAEELIEDEPEAEQEPQLPIERLKASIQLASMPAIDAPSVNPTEPEVSYKIDFTDRSHWHASTDGGKTKTSTESDVVAGAPIDLQLQISAVQQANREGFDQRLRLAFIEPDGGHGTLAELNLNAVSITRDGNPYVTSGARSLIGALLAISESDEDMANFCQAARFRLLPGRGKGIFVQVDIAYGGRWVEMSSALNTNAVPKHVSGMHGTLALIKQRFRSCGHFLTAAAVTGTVEEWHATQREEIPVVAIDTTAVISD